LTKFPTELIAAVPNIREFAIYSYTFDKIEFDDTMANLDVLYVIINKLKTFKSTLTVENAKIRYIDLYYNELSTIEKDTFKNMNEMQIISVSTNRVMTIHPDAFKHMKYLKKLGLDHNPLKIIDLELFQSLQPNLNELILSSTDLYELPKAAFKNFVNLTLIDLQQNRLSTFNARDLQLSFCKTLDLSENKIYNISLHGVTGLVELDLASNFLSVFNSTEIGLTSCMTLKLNKNILRIFDARNLESLDEVDLAYNILTTLSTELFSEGITLKKYDFRSNHIKSIEKKFMKLLGTLLMVCFQGFPCAKEKTVQWWHEVYDLKQCFKNYEKEKATERMIIFDF
jgi:Leucine-rich repeat (LRR) protein